MPVSSSAPPPASIIRVALLPEAIVALTATLFGDSCSVPPPISLIVPVPNGAPDVCVLASTPCVTLFWPERALVLVSSSVPGPLWPSPPAPASGAITVKMPPLVLIHCVPVIVQVLSV